VNRQDLRKLAQLRLAEAQLLFAGARYSGAYYLAGYAAECAVKACVAKQFKRSEFPDKRMVNDSYTHDLVKLIKLAGLQSDLDASVAADPTFETYWAVTKDWSEESRYTFASQLKARDLLDAISDLNHGTLQWIRARW
jgi:hypothetical protein